MPQLARRTAFTATTNLLYGGRRGPDVLLLADSPTELLQRADEWDEDTGGHPSVLTPLLSIPVPLYIGDRPFRDVPAKILWHPLFWLPPRLAERYQVQSPEGMSIEDDVTWAVRVCLDMTASGVYNPDDESWVDILAMAGLDVEDDIDLARVEAWQDGEPDDDLDGLAGRIEKMLDIPEEDAFYALAASSMDALAEAAAARTASVLLREELEPILDPSAEDLSVAHSATLTAVYAARLFLQIPVPGVDDGLWGALVEEIDSIEPSDTGAVLDRVAEPAAAALETIVQHFGPALEFWEKNTAPEPKESDLAAPDASVLDDLDFDEPTEPAAIEAAPGAPEPPAPARFSF